MKRYMFCILAVLGFAGLLIAPDVAAVAGRDALNLCLNSIIPTLFPFFIFSSMFVSLGFARILGKAFEGIMRPLFNVSGEVSSAFLLGLVSGFPVGAKTAISLYDSGLCTKAEAERTLAFCNNAGPAFVLGTVGVGIWNSTRVGWMLWLTQVFSSIITGIIFGFIWKRNDKEKVLPHNQHTTVVRLLPAFVDAVKTSAVSLMYISAFIVFFAVVIEMLSVFGVLPVTASLLAKLPVNLSAGDWENLLSGIVEFTSGIKMIGRTEPYRQSLVMTAAVLGWAGMSVHCQVLSFVYDSGLSVKPYILGKFLQSALSSALTYVMSFFIECDISVSVFAPYGNVDVTGVNFLKLFSISALLFMVFVACLTLFSYCIIKRK